MRIVIRLEPENGELPLPIQYNHLVQAMIYQSLDKALAEWLHERGYPYGKRRFKLFTFSRLMAPKKYRYFDRENKLIIFKGPISLKVASVEIDILESLAVYLVRNRTAKLNGVECLFSSIEVEMPVKADGPIVVRTLSPITVRRTLYTKEGKQKSYYYNPKEREFEQLILDNLRRKAKAYYKGKKDLPSLDNAYIMPIKIGREAVVNFKGTIVKGWMGIFEINFPEPYFTLAYDSGLGSKNSQGFGMVEVVRE